jgi:tetratricopeptide (TPR) repeat protein
MLKLVSFILASVFLAKCNNGSGTEDPQLSQPPYDKITDSIHNTPKEAGLYYRRGTTLYKNGEMSLAEKDLRSAWKLDPKEDYALRLTTILKQVNTDKAISFLQEALKKYPTSLPLNILLARGYQNKNELDKALVICNEIMKQYPGQLDALTLKAELLKQQNKTEESLTVLEQA